MRIFLLVLLLVGCGGGPKGKLLTYPPSPFNMPADMIKTGETCMGYGDPLNPTGPVESTPVLWNGQVLLVTSATIGRDRFRIDTFDCKYPDLFEPAFGWHVSPGYYANTFVHSGTMYVYGQSGNDIAMTSSTDLITWTPPVVVLKAPTGMTFFNTSITADANGFMMAVETQDKAYEPVFVIHFAHSADLQTWTMLPDVYMDSHSTENIANCPWLWFNPIDNKYYMLYLTIAGVMTDATNGRTGVTLITRSDDLVTWEDSLRPNNLVPFTVSPGEGVNISDVALLEDSGKVYAVYARGDQMAGADGQQTFWLELATATYNGTLNEFASMFF